MKYILKVFCTENTQNMSTYRHASIAHGERVTAGELLGDADTEIQT